jgi:hypothetical protein
MTNAVDTRMASYDKPLRGGVKESFSRNPTVLPNELSSALWI